MQKDLKSQFIPGKSRVKYGGAVIDKKEIRAIEKVLKRNWWMIDEETKKFEEELAKSSGVKYSLFVNSGSSALLLAISSLQLPKGSEVIIPAVNFPTVVNAVLLNDLVPVFVDVSLENLCIDFKKAEKAVTSKTKAIVVVDIAGNTSNLESLKFFKNKNIKTVLDNCDGYGTRYKRKPIETFFDISATSFHVAHIITTGEGGAIFTNDKNLYERSVSMREWGRSGNSDKFFPKNSGLPVDYPARYTYITRGFNLKPIELQAAMGRVQLKKLASIRKKRSINYKRLAEGFRKRNFPAIVSKPPTNSEISWFSFPFTLKKEHLRPKLRSFLESKNIETRVIFSGNIVRQPAYKNGDCKIGSTLENADYVLENSLFISAHPSLTPQMITYVLNSLETFFKLADQKKN